MSGLVRQARRETDNPDEAAGTALVVYESMFGNTEAVARAVADGLSKRLDVRLVEVSEAPVPVPDGTDLLVVGGPAYAFALGCSSLAGTSREARTMWISSTWTTTEPDPRVEACDFVHLDDNRARSARRGV